MPRTVLWLMAAGGVITAAVLGEAWRGELGESAILNSESDGGFLGFIAMPQGMDQRLRHKDAAVRAKMPHAVRKSRTYTHIPMVRPSPGRNNGIDAL